MQDSDLAPARPPGAELSFSKVNSGPRIGSMPTYEDARLPVRSGASERSTNRSGRLLAGGRARHLTRARPPPKRPLFERSTPEAAVLRPGAYARVDTAATMVRSGPPHHPGVRYRR